MFLSSIYQSLLRLISRRCIFLPIRCHTGRISFVMGLTDEDEEM